MENYIDETLFSEDVKLFVLGGMVKVEIENQTEPYFLTAPDGRGILPRGMLATITAIGGQPAYYALLHPEFQEANESKSEPSSLNPSPAITREELLARNHWLTR